MSSDFVPALRYRVLTRFYDPVVRLTTRERRVKQRLLQAAAIPPGATVVDLGCGTGTMSIWLKKQHPDTRVIGLDADGEILELARQKANRAKVDIEFLEANAADTSLPHGSIDRVVSSLFFHHLLPDQKRQVLTEVLRILKDDGEMHVADWGRPSSALMRWLFFLVQLLDGFPNTNDSVAGYLPGMLIEAGARNVDEHQHFNTILGTLRLLKAAK